MIQYVNRVFEAEKVKYLSDIRLHPNKTIRQAEMTLFCGGNVQDAEGLLLQSGLIFRAIMLNLKLYRWDRSVNTLLIHYH